MVSSSPQPTGPADELITKAIRVTQMLERDNEVFREVARRSSTALTEAGIALVHAGNLELAEKIAGIMRQNYEDLKQLNG